MKLNSVFILLFACVLSACSDQATKEHLHKKHSGMYMDHGTQQGQYYHDPKGNTFFYRHITTTITNDSMVPLNLEIGFTTEYHYPAPFEEQSFKLFLLPESLAGDQQDHEKVLRTFLDTALEKPSALYKTIQPKQELNITIGILTNKNAFAPTQLALITKGHRPHFINHDSLISHKASTTNPLDLLFALDFNESDCPSCFSVIPCGKMTHSK